MRAIGFNQGQFGDLCMNLVACRAFKETHNNSHLTFSINKKYSAIEPIFLKNELIDEIHIWDGYDNWPSNIDKEYIDSSRFDIIFHPMACLRPNWQPFRHQTEEICLVHQLNPPKDLKINLNKYFETDDSFKNYISICYKGSTDPYKKNLKEEYVNKLCKMITSLGYKPLFFQDQFENYDYFKGDFFDSIKVMLGTKLLVTIDSALSWIASGYNFPTIGLYNQNYYAQYGAITSKNWQPINPNGIYLESADVNNINIDNIKDNIEKI